MKKHKGLLIRTKIKESGLKFNEVAKQLKISRGSLYNLFKKSEIGDTLIIRIGEIVRYDFSLHIPHLKGKINANEKLENYNKEESDKIFTLQKKYYNLLEKHNELLKLLFKIFNEEPYQSIQEELKKFMNS